MTHVNDDRVKAEDVDADGLAAYVQERIHGAWQEPERAKARASAEPMTMYVNLAASTPVLRTGEANVTLLKMEDIIFVNKHHDVRQASKFLGSSRPAIPLGLDGREHTKYRRLLDPVFTAKRVAPLAPRVRHLANELIDTFIEAGEADVYRQWCEPLPSTIFLSIMGLPLEDLDDFLRFKDLTLSNESNDRHSVDELVAMRMEAVNWIHNYFNGELDRREQGKDPGDDLIGGLLTTTTDGDRLSREEILDIIGLLMIAGLDTVAASLACFLSYLARNPQQRARVLADRSLWPGAVEELMRYESPVTDGGRIALSDLDLPSGQHIPAGTRMSVCWHAADLDPDFFPHPLTVDFERTPNKHIGFASGWHRCLGSHLARMEMVAAMEVWHDRIPDYRIKDGVELVYSGNPRAPHHFPLVW